MIDVKTYGDYPIGDVLLARAIIVLYVGDRLISKCRKLGLINIKLIL